MIRATISFKTAEGLSEGWLTDLELPRIGDEIVLRDYGGELLRRGRVTDVRHLIFGNDRDYRAGASQIEVDVDAS